MTLAAPRWERNFHTFPASLERHLQYLIKGPTYLLPATPVSFPSIAAIAAHGSSKPSLERFFFILMSPQSSSGATDTLVSTNLFANYCSVAAAAVLIYNSCKLVLTRVGHAANF